jgi:hypothetical protein
MANLANRNFSSYAKSIQYNKRVGSYNVNVHIAGASRHTNNAQTRTSEREQKAVRIINTSIAEYS